jgi:branched-chain amino acid transport system substrate-binding protein
MLKALALALAVPLALAVAACSSGSGTGSSSSGGANAGSGGKITIGATLSLTGSLSVLGPPLEAGYEQEIADVNAAGGIAVGGTKEKLKLVVLDNGSDPGTASAQARDLVLRDHAVALPRPTGRSCWPGRWPRPTASRCGSS